jgi:hypothetical protein
MAVRPVGAELFHADGRTDMTKLIVAIRSFANALKNKMYTSFVRSYNLNSFFTVIVFIYMIIAAGVCFIPVLNRADRRGKAPRILTVGLGRIELYVWRFARVGD